MSDFFFFLRMCNFYLASFFKECRYWFQAHSRSPIRNLKWLCKKNEQCTFVPLSKWHAQNCKGKTIKISPSQITTEAKSTGRWFRQNSAALFNLKYSKHENTPYYLFFFFPFLYVEPFFFFFWLFDKFWLIDKLCFPICLINRQFVKG